MTTTVIKMKMSDLAPSYKSLGKRVFVAARRGAIRGAYRARAELTLATSAKQVVNTGFYKRAWKVEALSDGARVFNIAPYSGIIEYGRRPGRFPPPQVIEVWARRKLGLSAKEAKKAAFPIARAIAKRGLAARNVLTDKLPDITKMFMEEVEKELDRELAKKVKGK